MFLLACTEASPPSPPEFVDPDGAEVTVGEDGGLTLTDAEGTSRRIELGFGFVPNPDDDVNYDPWNLYAADMADAVPAGLQMLAPTSAGWNGDCFDLAFSNGETGRLGVDDAGPGVRLSLRQPDGAERAPYAFVRAEVTSDEGLYGLGEQFGSVEHRGRTIAMQFELEVALESGYNEQHVPVPLVVSSAGWGGLADSTWPGVVDVAGDDPEAVTWTFEADGGLDFDLYGPGTGAAVTARYSERTGMPEVPPDWAFGVLQWRNAVEGQDVILEDAAAIRDNGVATSLIWVDNPWQTLYNSMVPDEDMFPDWEGMVATLHDAGFRFMAWTTPYVENADPEHGTYEANGWFVDLPVVFNSFGDLVDLTHPDAAAAWTARVEAARERGIEGWKLDYGEDIQVGIGTARVKAALSNGEDERTMHHRYAIDYHRAYSTGAEEETFLLGRGGVLGGQAATDCIWPGDLDSDFRTHREDGYWVGGLPAAIRGGSSLAVSGYPFFASDVGGYRNNRPTRETMIRWMEYAATLPIVQYGGGGGDHNPWNFEAEGESQFDEETLAAFKRYATWHVRMFPYFELLAARAGATGEPFVLPEGLAYPDLGIHPQDAYLVGADVFVAPVETEGAVTRELTLPPGRWMHWWTGEALEGEQTVDAALGDGPLFQREGSAIPMLRRSVVTLAPSDGSADSWADDAGPLNVRVVPGDGAAFVLATGEALSWSGATATLASGDLYAGWDLEIWAPDGVTSVTVDGEGLAVGAEGCEACWFEEAPWVRVVLDGGTVVTVE